MAGFRVRNGSFQILFRWQGKQHFYSLGQVAREIAEDRAAKAQCLLTELKNGWKSLPSGVAITDYIRLDGNPAPMPQPEVERLKLAAFRDKYVEAHSGSLEPSTVSCIQIHFRHFENVLGRRFDIAAMTLADLQSYVTKRAKAKGRNSRPLSATTIQKEVMTLKAAWRWGVRMGLLAGAFPNDGLRYPRGNEKPPFMTRAEIERQIAGLSEAKRAERWECLYLTVEEVADLLEHVRQKAMQPFLYPALCFVAYTGARRSELLRANVADVDFESRQITIHEKKRAKGKNTTRRVPLTPFLERALKDWLAIHPGGPSLFCQEDMSRKGVQRKGKSAIQLNRGKAYDHLTRCLAGSKWEVLPGYHTLRHSFISACAASNVDQRFIDEWVGHQTEAMRKRYRHLTPSSQQTQISRVFG